MSCLIKICLDGDSKSYDYNRAYIDIPIYDQELVSLPDVIAFIKTSSETTQILIDSDLIKKYEILTEKIRVKIKKEKRSDFELDNEHCKLILYPKQSVIYHGQEIKCYAVLIWHVDRDILRLIHRSCRF